jgi:L-alanine-DL-glutamate epimerase-like enolase superfamily enzyme
VSSDDIAGLRLLRDRVPAPIEIAAGEYAYDLDSVRRTLEAGAVDVQQADASRCCGISGFLAAGALCDAHHIDLSGHCAPSLHVHAACAVRRFRHLEYFHDHVRIESILFDGAAQARGGMIAPDLSRPGLGLDFKQADAARYSA